MSTLLNQISRGDTRVAYQSYTIQHGIEAIQVLLSKEFWINPVSLIAPVAVIVLSAMRKPALPSLWTGANSCGPWIACP